MILFPHSANASSFAAFVGALLTTLCIYALAYFADSSRTTIVLAGITVSSFLNAGINTIKLINADISINLTSFLMGSLSGLTMNKLVLPCTGVIIAIIITMFFHDHLIYFHSVMTMHAHLDLMSISHDLHCLYFQA